ncbi:PTS transporter subunit EIIC [Paenibacillus sp. 481]|nr:PTS transporter subunit EIIC [Paenibacillus sp. 481]
MSYMQKVGRALMVPIAVLPAASILVRIGDIQAETPWLAALASVSKLGGDAIFQNLPLFFAIGVAIGLTSGQGVAALAAAVGYTVFTNVLQHFQTNATAILDTGVLGGMLCGWLAAYLYHRFHRIQLPEAVGFFGGKRFVPIITAIVMVGVGVAVGMVWPTIQEVIRQLGIWMMNAGEWGAGAYGLMNRLLIPTGLHHILNNIAWFQIGEFTTDSGTVVRGDILRFNAGDPEAGTFMTGYFLVMMFGLPGYALAIVHVAHPQARTRIASIMLTAALTSFLTGLTEPLEFAFMLTVPLLYAVHAVLTGVAMMITVWLDIRAGFSFSAGAIDLVLSWHLGNNLVLLLMLGIGYFALYYGVALCMIKMFDLQPPGRRGPVDVQPAHSQLATLSTSQQFDNQLAEVIRYAGGLRNIRDVDACITRLRLRVWDPVMIANDDASLLASGIFGTMKVAKDGIHFIIGTESDVFRDNIEQQLQKDNERLG